LQQQAAIMTAMDGKSRCRATSGARSGLSKLVSSLSLSSHTKSVELENEDRPPNLTARIKSKVTFGKVQVQEFAYNPADAPKMYYSRPEMQLLNEGRHKDAYYLRQGGLGGFNEDRKSACGIGPNKSKSESSLLLAAAITSVYSEPDDDDAVTIRGIEHFVYSELKQEMIESRRIVRREVVKFGKKNRKKDPRHLAKISSDHSQWARDVATERGLKYVENQRGTGILLKMMSHEGMEQHGFRELNHS